MRGMEACGQSIDVAGEEGGRREGVGQSLQAEYRHVRFSQLLFLISNLDFVSLPSRCYCCFYSVSVLN